jgi:TRL-like protein family
MRKLSVLVSLTLITAAYLSLTGCMIVDSPMRGAFYTEAKYGDFATIHPSATKEGKACGQSILGLVATGDASVAAAKAAGGVTTVASVDHYAKNILGIIGEWCTIVKGS